MQYDYCLHKITTIAALQHQVTTSSPHPESDCYYTYFLMVCRCHDKAFGSWVGTTEYPHQLHRSWAHWGDRGHEKTRYVLTYTFCHHSET